MTLGYRWMLRVYTTEPKNQAGCPNPIGFVRAVRRADGMFQVRGAELVDPSSQEWTKFSGSEMWMKTLIERFNTKPS